MQVKSLSIRRREPYEPDAGRLVGKVTFASGLGEVEINIGEDESNKLMVVVANLLVEHTQKVARQMTAEVFTTTSQLPAPETPSVVVVSNTSPDDDIPF